MINNASDLVSLFETRNAPDITLLFILETAINIGYSCQLLTDEMMDVFIVDASTYDEVHQQLLKFRDSIKIYNTFHPQSPTEIPTTTDAINGDVDGIRNQSVNYTTSSQQSVQTHAVSVVTFRYFYVSSLTQK